MSTTKTMQVDNDVLVAQSYDVEVEHRCKSMWHEALQKSYLNMPESSIRGLFTVGDDDWNRMFNGWRSSALSMQDQQPPFPFLLGTTPAIYDVRLEGFNERLAWLCGFDVTQLPLKDCHAVVAGGSVIMALVSPTEETAARAFFAKHCRGGDVDIFITAEDACEAAQYATKLQKALNEIVETKSVSLTMFSVSITTSKSVVQIVIQFTPTVASLLSSFDLDSCTFAFNGEAVFASPRGCRAVATGVNVADPRFVHAPTLTLIRMSKYAHRGWVIVAPGTKDYITSDTFLSGFEDCPMFPFYGSNVTVSELMHVSQSAYCHRFRASQPHTGISFGRFFGFKVPLIPPWPLIETSSDTIAAVSVALAPSTKIDVLTALTSGNIAPLAAAVSRAMLLSCGRAYGMCGSGVVNEASLLPVLQALLGTVLQAEVPVRDVKTDRFRYIDVIIEHSDQPTELTVIELKYLSPGWIMVTDEPDSEIKSMDDAVKNKPKPKPKPNLHIDHRVSVLLSCKNSLTIQAVEGCFIVDGKRVRTSLSNFVSERHRLQTMDYVAAIFATRGVRRVRAHTLLVAGPVCVWRSTDHVVAEK